MLAIRNDYDAEVLILTDHGADPNLQSCEMHPTPYELAMHSASSNIQRCLLIAN